MKENAKITTFFLAILLILTAFTMVTVVSIGALGARGSSRAAPTLTNGTVTPATGNTSTMFEFKVTYTDSDNDSAWYIYVILDGSPKSLSRLNGTAKTGEVYNYKSTLSAGNHTYYFFVNNSVAQTARYPATGTLFLLVNSSTGSPPTLTNPSVYPLTGNSSTMFTFNITYTDVDNDQPTNMSIVIDGSWSYKMTFSIGSATTGMKYTYQTTLSTGSHTYFFMVYNSVAESARNPTSGSYMMNVTSPKPLPMLWGGGVDPTSGNSETIFTFSVNYKDPGNNWNCDIIVQINEQIYMMTTTGQDLIQGVEYTFSTKLTKGDYNYYFNSDNSESETVREPSSGLYQLQVDPFPGNAPELFNPQTSPVKPTEEQTINFSIQYKDIDNDAPKLVELYINRVELSTPFDKYNMNIIGNTFSTGINCYTNLKLNQGNYTYYFIAESSNASINNFYQTGYFFIIVDPGVSPPTLSGGGVTPMSGTANSTMFTYSVIYQDGIFGSAVVSIVNIDNNFHTMTEAPGDSGSLGVYYTYSTTLSTGTHTFNFIFSNGKVNVTLPVSGMYNGPDVNPSNNNPPVIQTNLKDINEVLKDTSMYISALESYDLDNDPITYLWKLTHSASDYSKIFTVGNFNHRFDLIGKYTLTLEISDGLAITSDTYVIECIDPSQLSSPVAKATSLVNGMSVSLSAQDSYDLDGFITSYTWGLLGLEYQGMIYNHTFSTIGYKTATLIVTDNHGLTDKTVVGFFIGKPSMSDSDNPKVGGHIEIKDDEVSIINSEEGFNISIIESGKSYLKFRVNSDLENGRLVIMDVMNLFDLSQLDKIQVEINGVKVKKTDLNTILKTSSEMPLYCIVGYDDYYQLLVYMPNISNQVVEVELKEDSDIQNPLFDSFWYLLLIFVIVLIFIIIAAFSRIKKKEEKEYYRDFRVAEHKTQNGVHTPTLEATKEDSDNWDDFI